MESSIKKLICLIFVLQLIDGLLCFNYEEEMKKPGYGTEWFYFPDGKGVPHIVNLTMLPEETPMGRSGILVDGNIEYRFNSRNHHYSNDFITLDESGSPKSVDEEVIKKSVSNKLVKVVTHGWWSTADDSVVVNITNAYLRAQDVIVIGINWGDTSKDLLYPIVAEETLKIGTRVGSFLRAFCNRYEIGEERVHLIGHSLGAHVMGIAGATSGMKVGRITGLDPARPLFEWPFKKPDAKSLDASDAQFVDIIHTCGGLLGVRNPIGHADFYPNSGTAPQPGCIGWRINAGFNYEEEMKKPGYGTEWFYFPDGKGVPHIVNLTMLPEETPMGRSGILVDGNIEYRFNSRNHHYSNDFITLDESGSPKSVDEEVIKKSVSNKLVKVVTHGWWSTADDSVVVNITNAYLRAQDVIVIGINWGDTSKDLLYPIVAEETLKIGTRVGSFLRAFCNRYEIGEERVHLIGHSLGAHVMGIAGATSGMKVGRITGLDPARPLFEWPFKKPDAKSLDASDAQFVDIIHTCGGLLGVRNPIGHADFYPNSGTAPQPGCIGWRINADPCSHSRSHEYFAESIISPTEFPACKNWTDGCHPETYMGDSVSRQASGQFYLNATLQYPFDSLTSTL